MHSGVDRLFTAATGGDRLAFERMLELYLPQLHAYVQVRLGAGLRPRESSLDVVQSVCRQVLAAGPPAAIDSEERFRAWLFTSAVNKMREKVRLHHSQRRDIRREERALAVDPVTAAAVLDTPSQSAIGRETAAAVMAALAALSEEHREVVTLARLVRLPHRVIAEVMQRSEPAVRQLLARALLALAGELERRGIDMEKWAK